jgi:plastocyanin
MSAAMRRAGLILLGSAAMAAIVVGACGGDDDTGGGEGDVTVVGEDTLSFDKGDYTAQAGEITIVYEAGGSMVHTLLIEGVDDVKLQVSSTGDSDSGTVELEPGSYELYCDVPGHEAMRATLTVS